MLGESEKAMQEFHENYCASRNIRYGGRIVVPKKQDYKIVEMWKQKKTIREISQKFGMSQSQVDSAINRVSRFNLKQ